MKDMEDIKDLKICIEPNKFELIKCIYANMRKINQQKSMTSSG